MQIFSWSSPFGNIGDDLNHWLWPRLLGDIVKKHDDTILVGIGSVLTAGFNEDFFSKYPKKILLGAGTRDRKSTFDLTGKDWDIRFVRGRGTTSVFGLAPEKAISDPAILVSRLLPNNSSLVRKKSVLPKNPVIGFVPYWGMTLPYGQALSVINDLKYIPVHLPPVRFFNLIASCDAVVVEAMHGAIIADSLGVPWMPCRMNNWKSEGETHTFKWKDWLDTLNLAPDFVVLPETARMPGASLRSDVTFGIKVRAAAYGMRKAFKSASWNLSDRALLFHRQSQVLDVIGTLRQELTN